MNPRVGLHHLGVRLFPKRVVYFSMVRKGLVISALFIFCSVFELKLSHLLFTIASIAGSGSRPVRQLKVQVKLLDIAQLFDIMLIIDCLLVAFHSIGHYHHLQVW